MYETCPKCQEKANGIRCDYICKGILPKWIGVDRSDLYKGRRRTYRDD